MGLCPLTGGADPDAPLTPAVVPRSGGPPAAAVPPARRAAAHRRACRPAPVAGAGPRRRLVGSDLPPPVTLWAFLGPGLGADHSCRAAVARLIAHRGARGPGACSARAGAYRRARKRPPEAFFREAAPRTGRVLDDRAGRGWRWKGRRVYLFDGATAAMPDTPANQAAYPQAYNQGPGRGSPIARPGAVIAPACGAVANLGSSRYAGKGGGGQPAA